MFNAITLKHGAKNTTIKMVDNQKFSLPASIGEKLSEQLKPYFGCAFMPDWLAYDIPDSEVESVESSIYQMFGSHMTAITE